MKKVINVYKVNLVDILVLDRDYSKYTGEPFDTYCRDNLAEYKPYKSISIMNVRSVSAELLTLLTPYYLGGTEIIINSVSFINPNPKFRYDYHWVDFNRNHISKSLANYPVGQSTFLVELDKVKTNYLPNNLWVALDEYSQHRIEKCKQYNKTRFNYDIAEQWYKDLMFAIPTLTAHMPKYQPKTKSKYVIKATSDKPEDKPEDKEPAPVFKVFSPNKKTFYEFTAETNFNKSLELLKPGLRPLTTEEIAFLKQYAPAYGIEIPQFAWRINSRKTEHGYTYEPERVLVVKQSDIDRTYVNPANKRNKLPVLSKFVRDGYKVKYNDNDKLLRDSYTQLIWMMKHDKKGSFLASGYHHCPICHKIFHETQGCDGHIEPIEFINADNMLYGISSTYEDYDSTSSYYQENLD